MKARKDLLQGEPEARQNLCWRRFEAHIVVSGRVMLADIQTDEKAVVEYPLKPIYKALSEAFRER